MHKATEDVAEDDNVNTNYDARPADPPILPDVQQVAEEGAMLVDAGHVPHVPDIFCPDRVYHNLPATVQVPPPPCQDNIAQILQKSMKTEMTMTGSFMTEADLKKHHDMLTMECNIYYPWHVWI